MQNCLITPIWRLSKGNHWEYIKQEDPDVVTHQLIIDWGEADFVCMLDTLLKLFVAAAASGMRLHYRPRMTAFIYRAP